MAASSRHFTVLGAGTVGVCTALSLLRDGHRVSLIDRLPPGSGCSFGNGGLIQTGACVPIATPGVLRQVPSMLLDPDGPLVIRWRHLGSLAPYLCNFVLAARPGRVEEISLALHAILCHAKKSYQVMLAAVGASHLIRPSGELYVYERKGSFDRAKQWHDLRRKRGVEVIDVESAELRHLEPGLAPIFYKGVYLPDSSVTLNPHLLARTLAEAFAGAGGELVQAEACEVLTDDGRPTVLVTDQGRRPLDQLVIATGAFSRRWAKQLAADLPLNTERGYHLMLPAPGVNLRVPVLSGDFRFALVPMIDGVRLAGTAELAALDAPPRWKRAERLLRVAQRMLPGLDGTNRSRWMGLRPSTPDSLPVIGRSPRYPSVYLAFGHGHLGLTLGAVTGRIVADLAAGRTPPVPLAPYDIRRFSWSSA